MKYLVLGGAGFIGSHLVDFLLKDKNNEIIVIDDFSEGRLANLPKNPRLEVIRESILSGKIKKYFRNVDVVCHLAALTRPRWSIEYPVETNNVNVNGTLEVLKLCVDEKVGRIIYISSASTYGYQKQLLLKEDTKLNPMSPYAMTKLVGENYCRLFGDLYGLKYDIVRPFNVFGPRQSLYGEYSAAVPNFIYKLKVGETPFITGDGTQVRDFVYVKDVASLIASVTKWNGSSEIFNAGSGKATSINYLYKKICKLLNKDTSPKYVDRVIDPETKASIVKAKKLLNWKPKYSLEGGLRETIAWRDKELLTK